MEFTFNKKERLHRHALIRSLFSEGRSFTVYPFRVTWRNPERSLPGLVQVLISVPKSNLRLAVDRNRVRRRIREAYRLNKATLMEALSKHPGTMIFCITYTSKEILPAATIREKIILILQRLMKENEKVTG